LIHDVFGGRSSIADAILICRTVTYHGEAVAIVELETWDGSMDERHVDERWSGCPDVCQT
jgi:hypothetical protein